jgi:hypothetical protein
LINTVRDSLRRSLPRPAYQFLRMQFWRVQYYWPRVASSLITPRRAIVRSAPGRASESELVRQLTGVNISLPTNMCQIMTEQGSDKGNGHTYTPIYSALLGGLRNEPLRIFELGLGTNNPEIPANMGVDGVPGASLRGWREIFPKALVYGADIDRGILFEEDRIKTFFCDQLDRTVIAELWSQPELQGGMDIIVEDGLHTFEANMSFLDASIGQVRPGGLYIVEDIGNEETARWAGVLGDLQSRYPGYVFALVEMPNPVSEYNNMLVVRRDK